MNFDGPEVYPTLAGNIPLREMIAMHPDLSFGISDTYERKPIDNATLAMIGDSLVHQTFSVAPDGATFTEQEDGSFILETFDPDQANSERFATTRLFFRTAKEEMGEKPTKEKIADAGLITVSGAGFVFEQGPWNEMVVTILGREIIENLAERGNVSLTAVSVAGGLAVWSIFEHSVLGAAMARNIERFPKSIRVLEEELADSDALRNSRDRKLPARFWNAFSVGSATVNIEDSITDPEFITEKKGYKRALGSAALIASGSGAIGAVAGAGFQQAINTGHQAGAEQVLDVVSSPFLWTGGFVAFRIWEYAKNRRTRIKNETGQIEEPAHISTTTQSQDA